MKKNMKKKNSKKSKKKKKKKKKVLCCTITHAWRSSTHLNGRNIDALRQVLSGTRSAAQASRACTGSRAADISPAVRGAGIASEHHPIKITIKQSSNNQ
jgi:hypothetical protein